MQGITNAVPNQELKTINGTSLAGSGNFDLQPTLVSGTNIKTINNTSLLGSENISVQPTLVSGTNIKKINNTDVIGSGNINIPTLSVTTLDFTLDSTKWNASQYQDLKSDKLTASTNGVFGLKMQDNSAQYEAATKAQLQVISQGVSGKQGYIRVKYFGDKPTINIDCVVMV